MGREKEYKIKSLLIKLIENDEAVILKWSGESTDREPGIFLGPIFEEAVKACLAGENKKELILDFTSLEYMNSSTITPIVKEIKRAIKTQSPFSIRYDKNLKWQELSFSALSVFELEWEKIRIFGI
ncbi:MAG: hypothetical protein H7A25_19015 [Leptospiraceae bacterium]|nr:hypothetical protein [Leptospiraceae bacterium]MCP5502001.1 hypothetical protein [Leptospiraceae bacterium]